MHTSSPIRKIKCLAATLAVLFCLSGCAAVIVGGAAAGGTYYYVTGWLNKDYNVTVNQAYAAGMAACKDLGLSVKKHSKNLTEASIDAKDSDRDVWITMDSKTERITKISVRVGLTGDKVASQRIHDAIARHL
ncbi:MAG: DUF3568 family protein [Desulfovibrio sp.]|uniref:DUF3568 family protein n=1 Tax=Desulfovibrio sp. 7SRBS1 TaxID=3378064 RepID=UPI003B418FDF